MVSEWSIAAINQHGHTADLNQCAVATVGVNLHQAQYILLCPVCRRSLSRVNLSACDACMRKRKRHTDHPKTKLFTFHMCASIVIGQNRSHQSTVRLPAAPVCVLPRR